MAANYLDLVWNSFTGSARVKLRPTRGWNTKEGYRGLTSRDKNLTRPHMCMLSKSFFRISVAMAVAIPNCIGVVASVHAASTSCNAMTRQKHHPKAEDKKVPRDRDTCTKPQNAEGIQPWPPAVSPCRAASTLLGTEYFKQGERGVYP